jgi:hypothetical protein
VAGLSIAAAMVFGAAGVAGAQSSDPYAGPPSTVLSDTTDLPPADAAAGGAAASESGSVTAADTMEVEGTSLAFTGGDIAALLGIGIAVTALGTFVLFARRQRPVTA